MEILKHFQKLYFPSEASIEYMLRKGMLFLCAPRTRIREHCLIFSYLNLNKLGSTY